MSVLIILPAMGQSSGLFRRAINEARARADIAEAICVASSSPDGLISGGGSAFDRVAGGLAEQARLRADAALEALAKRAERVGLELNARVEAGELPDRAVELIRESRADRVILIRPKSYMLGRLVDEIADALDDGFDGELVIV